MLALAKGLEYGVLAEAVPSVPLLGGVVYIHVLLVLSQLLDQDHELGVSSSVTGRILHSCFPKSISLYPVARALMAFL